MRIGIDLGGTKIEGIALGDSPANEELAHLRVPTPRDDYVATVRAIAEVVHDLEQTTAQRADARKPATVGVGIPGTIVRATGLVKNANSIWLNGMPLERDLSSALGRTVRCANDANCFAISEATDGAAAGRDAELVFGVILGTGCGGGIAIRGPQGMHARIGPNGLSGEWGHNPLPWATSDELPDPPCYCGKHGCLETWISGTGFERDYAGNGQNPPQSSQTAAQIASKAAEKDPISAAALARLEDRIGRALASIINILDPDVIVLGGGLSKLDRLYINLPPLVEAHIFGGGTLATPILKAKHGDSSGVRGAAWLWPI